MKFVCDRCQTKYSIADEKVRGKVLKVRCKTCSNVITVREPSSAKPSVPSIAPVRVEGVPPSASAVAPAARHAPASGGGGGAGLAARSQTQPVSASAVVGTAPAAARSPSASHAPVRAQAHAVSQARAHAEPASHPSPSGAYPATDLDELTEHTAIASVPAHFFAPTPPPLQKKPPRPPVAPVPQDDIPWFIALDGHQEAGGLTLAKLVERLLALPRGADVHVWNERMDGWKEPQEVPEVARELSAQRRRAAPPPPPRPAGRPTPPAPLVPTGALPGRSGTGAHAAQAHAVPGPLSGAAPRLPRPSVRASTLAATAAAQALDVDLDPSTMLETPGPKTHPVPGKANGAAATGRERSITGRAAAPLAPLHGGESDALNALNLGSRVGPAAGANLSGAAAVGGSAPRLVSADALVGADADLHAPEPVTARHRNAKLILGFIAIVAVVCVVLLVNVMKKPTPPAPGPATKAATGESEFGALAQKVADEKAAAPAVAPPPPPPPPPASNHSVKTVGKPVKGGRATTKGPVRGGAPAPAAPAGPSMSAADEANAARFRDDTGRKVTAQSGSASRATSINQADISRVINNNKNAIKTCYQRALLRDSSLTHGKITVHLNIGISGKVKTVGVEGPSSFRVLEPCIKEMVQRWMFPSSGESYETEFSYVFQGNE